MKQRLLFMICLGASIAIVLFTVAARAGTADDMTNWIMIGEDQDGDRWLFDVKSVSYGHVFARPKELTMSINTMSFNTKKKFLITINGNQCLSAGQGLLDYTPILNTRGKLGKTQQAYWDWQGSKVYDQLARNLCYILEGVILGHAPENWDRPNGTLSLESKPDGNANEDDSDTSDPQKNTSVAPIPPRL